MDCGCLWVPSRTLRLQRLQLWLGHGVCFYAVQTVRDVTHQLFFLCHRSEFEYLPISGPDPILAYIEIEKLILNCNNISQNYFFN